MHTYNRMFSTRSQKHEIIKFLNWALDDKIQGVNVKIAENLRLGAMLVHSARLHRLCEAGYPIRRNESSRSKGTRICERLSRFVTSEWCTF